MGEGGFLGIAFAMLVFALLCGAAMIAIIRTVVVDVQIRRLRAKVRAAKEAREKSDRYAREIETIKPVLTG